MSSDAVFLCARRSVFSLAIYFKDQLHSVVIRPDAHSDAAAAGIEDLSRKPLFFDKQKRKERPLDV